MWFAVVVAVALLLGACRGKTERSADAELSSGPVVRSSPRRLVVLGSSTAAGVGPRDPEDAYVLRYRAFLARQFPDFTLSNLAVSGYTSYHIQPTGFAPPPHRPAPEVSHNISQALALRPDAIVVNLPSNDVAEGFGAAEQLENLARVLELAGAARVLLWVSSTQPRNFSAAQIAAQRELRDAILNRYSPRILDFWTPFAAADGTIRREYDAGDGIHLNAAAHSILLKTLVAAKLPEAVLQAER